MQMAISTKATGTGGDAVHISQSSLDVIWEYMY